MKPRDGRRKLTPRETAVYKKLWAAYDELDAAMYIFRAEGVHPRVIQLAANLKQLCKNVCKEETLIKGAVAK